jgi:hypothetical protein
VLITSNSSGLVLSTGLAGKLRIIVLALSLVLFVMSLSSDIAYKDEFRLLVIVTAVFLMFFVGPRKEIMFINDEKKIKLITRFFVFSKTHELDMRTVEIAYQKGNTILISPAKTVTIYTNNQTGAGETLYKKIEETIQASRR